MEFAELIHISKVDGVTMHKCNGDSVEGTLCISGHHLILSSRQTASEELWLLHRNVDVVERPPSDSRAVLVLKCKDFEVIRLEIPNVDDCAKVAASVEALSNIDQCSLFPFNYRPMFEVLEDGWAAFTIEAEFNRIYKYSNNWRLSTANKSYQLCKSYPQLVIVPHKVSDALLQEAAQFRHGGRFPVLSYLHKPNGCALLRSGQPLIGPSGKRCKADAALLNAVIGSSHKGYIVDTRAFNVAKLAQSRGGGTEPEQHYPQWKRLTQPVERWPGLQEALAKLVEACADTTSSSEKWLSRLESCTWFAQIKDILTCACSVAQLLDKEEACILVHGSEGSDTTLQVSALSQLLMDPDCRSIRGFEALIEREWLQAGHPFQDRCFRSAYAASTVRQNSEAPTFLLFLDCVWQIWQQYPLSFEFNEEFLILLVQHAYASQFGTFLCNNDRERQLLKLDKKTVSLWSYVNLPATLARYINPLYEPNPRVLWPSVAPHSLRLWEGLYSRFLRHQENGQEIWHQVKEIKDRDMSLRSQVNKMRKQLITLEKEAIERGLVAKPSLS